ncbi:hypothetical protein SEVIR_3G139000v4 [Setaria viridis]|uniref:Uncharacterized protein n=2 Tax=Setaria TaxID=4554 RepID=K3ZAG1_SETIT|nr:uncharacterized protein LOC101777254 [Setaria italica]XP_034584724.1 uncharacterized protein LOC117847606 [Setaria viridis]RCV16425.1 hypothetical protein SETIT_3G137100v2 [Setaria italica]TKW25750.1 hypothetical protein SEVIR_3G139000v2 [Setaria viridis]
MAVSSISCALKPPAPVKEASARLQPSPPATNTPWSGGLRRACAAAAACVVIGTAGGGDAALARGGATVVPRAAGDVVAAVDARAPPRWSDRRECPPWRANSLENIVPENLPRPSARRSFNSIKAPERGPALAPEAVAPFLEPHSGLGCFSL